MLKKILVCLDGSKISEQVIPVVKDTAKWESDKVILYHVLEDSGEKLPHTLTEDIKNNKEMVEHKEKALKYLEEVSVPLQKSRINVEFQIGVGKTGESVVKFADDNNIGLIVLTSHGQGGLGRLVFGTTSIYVLRESRCPVLIVKPQRTR